MATLERISNIAVIIAACFVAGTAVYNRVNSPSVLAQASSFASKYKGKSIPLEGYQTGVPSVVIFASRDCHFCSESFPFYMRLASMRDSASGAMRVVSVFPSTRQNADETRKYFSDRGVAIDDALAARFTEIGVTGTPSIALVDRGGKVVGFWAGKLSAQLQDEVLDKFNTVCPACRKVGVSF
jgi:hypothetical protein